MNPKLRGFMAGISAGILLFAILGLMPGPDNATRTNADPNIEAVNAPDTTSFGQVRIYQRTRVGFSIAMHKITSGATDSLYWIIQTAPTDRDSTKWKSLHVTPAANALKAADTTGNFLQFNLHDYFGLADSVRKTGRYIRVIIKHSYDVADTMDTSSYQLTPWEYGDKYDN